VFEVKAIKGSANSVSQGMFGEGSVGLDSSAFTMCPLRFNRIEPGAFDWQEANQDTNSFSCLFDGAIMFTDPGAHSLAGVPTGVVPNHCQNRLVQFLNFLAASLQKLNVMLLTGRPSTKRKSIFSSLKSSLAIHLKRMP